MTAIQDLIDELPNAEDIIPGVTTGHVVHSGVYKQIFQLLANATPTDPHPHAISSPDASILEEYAMSQDDYDALGPGRPDTTIYFVPADEGS